jgi:hypothetical protein
MDGGDGHADEDDAHDDCAGNHSNHGGCRLPPPPTSSMQQFVDHAYTDYALVDEDELRLLDENPSLLGRPTSAAESEARERLRGMSCTYGPMKKNAGGVVQPFPGKVSSAGEREGEREGYREGGKDGE